MKRIHVRQEICSGCRACEVACVAFHEGKFGTATTRIHVTKIEPLGVDRPNVCRQCRHAPCIEACPTGALFREAKTGAILVRSDDCIGCSACVDACPFGVVSLHPETGIALICDLCGGDPECVKRCAPGAIVFADPGSRQRAIRKSMAIRAWENQEPGKRKKADE